MAVTSRLRWPVWVTASGPPTRQLHSVTTHAKILPKMGLFS